MANLTIIGMTAAAILVMAAWTWVVIRDQDKDTE